MCKCTMCGNSGTLVKGRAEKENDVRLKDGGVKIETVVVKGISHVGIDDSVKIQLREMNSLRISFFNAK